MRMDIARSTSPPGDNVVVLGAIVVGISMQNEPDRESLKTDGGDLITSSVTDGEDCKDCQGL